MLKEQLEAQQDILKTVMLGAQGAQLKLLEAKLEKYYYKSLNALNIVGCY